MSSSTPLSPEMLQALLSMDAAERKAAEQQLQATSRDDRLVAFCQVLVRPGGDGALFHMVAVLLRRDLLKLSAAQDATLLHNLLTPLLQAWEQSVSLAASSSSSLAVGHCLAELAAVWETTEPQGSSTSTQVVSQILGGSVATKASQGDLVSLQLLVALAERAPKSFCQVALPSLPQLMDSLVQHQVFHTENPQEVDPQLPSKGQLYSVCTELVTTTAVATVGGHASELLDTVTETQRPNPNSPASQLGTQALLPLLGLQHVFSDPDTVAKVLLLWMQAAQTAPDLFVASDKQVWDRTVLLCLQVSSQDHETKLAIQGMHVLNHLVRHLKNQLAEPMRRNLLQSIVPRIMNLLLNEVDYDVQAWAEEPVTSSLEDKDTFSDDDGQAEYAYEQLEAWIRTSPALVMSIALPLLETHLGGDWSHQWAVTVCIQACAEEAPVAFKAHVPTALQAALQLANSSNARVQYQAIQLLATLCESGNALIWEHFAERILQVLAQAVSNPSDRVRAMACTALVSYCRPEDKDKMNGARFVTPYLADLLPALVQGPMSCGSTAVQNRAVTAVICLAHVAGPAFVQYYANVMPVLLALAQQSKSNEYEDVKLQASAIEAATIVGQSLGESDKHLFAEDATRIMHWIIPVLQQGQDEASNVPMGLLLSACGRIAAIAGEAYAEFAQSVVPVLLSHIQAKTEIEIAEGDVSNLDSHRGVEVVKETGKERATVALPGHGLTQITINTTKIEEKAIAIRGIYEHALSLEGLFAPYVQPCVDVLLPLLKFRYAADVRATSAQSLAAVYEASCCHAEETGDFSVCSQILPKLLAGLCEQLRDENEMEALFATADALSEVMYSTYNRRLEHGSEMLRNFSVNDARSLANLCLKSALVPCLARRAKITQILSQPQELSGEDEAESYQQSLREEEKLLTPLVDSTGYTLKLFGPAFYPIFQQEVVPVLGPYLSEGLDIRARLSAMCLFDDATEFCGREAAAELGPSLIKGMLLGLDDSSNGGDDELKQAAVYGCIQLSRYAPVDMLVPYASAICKAVLPIARASKDEAPSPGLFENCVSSVASLFLIGQAPFQSSGLLQSEEASSLFLRNLPLEEDYDEAKICHSGFCGLVEAGKINAESECSTIVRIAGEILALVREEEDVATPETCDKLARILLDLQHSPKSTIVASAFESLPESSKSAIQDAVQELQY